jgi:V/A-type H+-transporting ATPase subunit B
VDRRYLAFGTLFEREVVSHAERRSLDESMDAGWQALRSLPRGELHRLSDRQITDHLGEE